MLANDPGVELLFFLQARLDALGSRAILVLADLHLVQLGWRARGGCHEERGIVAPLQPLQATLSQTTYQATPSPDGISSYRLQAPFEQRDTTFENFFR